MTNIKTFFYIYATKVKNLLLTICTGWKSRNSRTTTVGRIDEQSKRMNYKATTYKQRTWLTLTVVEQAASEQWLDTLCYFVQLKSLHTKPVIYNYSLRKLSASIGCSVGTIKHHLDMMYTKGLASVQGKHLRLKSANEFKSQEGYLVPVGVSLNKQEQRAFLRFVLIKRNLHKQAKAYSNKVNTLKLHKLDFSNLKEYKALKKSAGYYNPASIEKTMRSEFSLGNGKFGALCNRSRSTGLKIQKHLNKLGLIISTRCIQYTNYTNLSARAFYNLNLPSHYHLGNDGTVYKLLPNRIALTGE